MLQFVSILFHLIDTMHEDFCKYKDRHGGKYVISKWLIHWLFFFILFYSLKQNLARVPGCTWPYPQPQVKWSSCLYSKVVGSTREQCKTILVAFDVYSFCQAQSSAQSISFRGQVSSLLTFSLLGLPGPKEVTAFTSEGISPVREWRLPI